MQWPKEKRTKDDLPNTTQKTKDWATQTPLKASVGWKTKHWATQTSLKASVGWKTKDWATQTPLKASVGWKTKDWATQTPLKASVRWNTKDWKAIYLVLRKDQRFFVLFEAHMLYLCMVVLAVSSLFV
jgi:hypothetical protein